MQYSRTQKWLSSFLIFSLLFLQTFEVPMLDSTRAEASINADIISFIVEEDIYSGAVKSKILQYGKDIQAYLPNTRVVIFPVQKTTNPFSLASINEKLFYEGDGEGLSRLIGTVLIGEIPLPVVHKDEKAFMSVYPFVDFDSKSFVYDQTKNLYEYTTKTLTDEKPEIWHSVIRPNTGSATENKNELVAFFNKTHDFYNKQGLFSPENTPTEPRVFYMDAFHDQQTSSPDLFKSYNLLLENIEDIAYNRFNKYLAKKLYDASQGFYSLNSESVADPTIKSILEAYSGSTMDLSKAPDITTKDIIEKSVKQFFEVFNAKYMGDILKYIHNTGRYGDANNIRGDIAPVAIAKKDLFMRTTLKDANTSIEDAIDSLIQTTLAEPLKIATSYKIVSRTRTGASGDGASGQKVKSNTRVYKNYLFGQEASAITDMKQCTIVRGSTLKVESNRGYNMKNAETDANFLQSDLSGGACFFGGTSLTSSYWWGNSPLNFDMNQAENGAVTLKSHTYKNFVKPLYDIAGSRELETTSSLHTATPFDCLETNMLLQPYVGQTDDSGETTGWPPETGGTRFSCITTHQPLLEPYDNYYALSNNLLPEDCTTLKIELDGKVVQEVSDDSCDFIKKTKTYSFKTLTGSIIMEHKSPTDEEYGIELQEMITPSLPSDRDRFVDYIDKNLSYKKIIYPNFFRITLSASELNSDGATEKIKDLLDAKTAEIQSLGGDIDLYDILSSDEKALNTVVESVIWNNMKNATLKYASMLERSLDIDGAMKISADSKKNDYEIAYLGAPGDAQNMYLKVDPESKSPPSKEISDILNRVNNYHGLIDGSNISQVENEPVFQCGPPEGVPIWEWIPAVFCWLGTILPPTVSGGSCGGSESMSANTAQSSFSTNPANALDMNKNGIIDGYELIGKGELLFQNPWKVFGYGETVPLEALLTNNGKIIDIDSFNSVSFDIVKLNVISHWNTSVTVYDRTGTGAIAKRENISPYINFKPLQVRAQNGVAKYNFSTKNEDVDAVFDVRILTKDRYGRIVVDKKSSPVTVSVRSDRISIQSKTKTGNNSFVSNSVMDAGNPNGILFRLQKINKNQIVLSENLPYTLRVYDDIDNTLVHGPIQIDQNEYLFRDSLLETAGVYRFEFIDQKGIRGLATMTVLPALPKTIEVTPSSDTFVAGQKTTILVRILDEFGNLARGEVHKLNGAIVHAGFVDDNGQTTPAVSKNIIEGYASFDITAPNRSDAISLKFSLDKTTVSSEVVTLRAVDFAKVSVEVKKPENIIVGGNAHGISFRILDEEDALIDDYNGILALDFPKLSGTLSNPFVRIVNGVSETEVLLTPAYVAGKNLSIGVQVPGISAVEGNSVTILPEVPMSFSFVKRYDRMEAKEGNINNIRATLYDRYGNIAYNTTGHTLSVRIPEESSKYATISNASVVGNSSSPQSMEDILGTLSSLWNELPPSQSNTITNILQNLGNISDENANTTPGINDIIQSLNSIDGLNTSQSTSINDIIQNLNNLDGSNVSESGATYAFSGGVLDFGVEATGLPGKAYIIGTVTPGLESNSFTVTDKSESTLTVRGVSENVTISDTYYLFNKSKLDAMRYDAQYTVLLWGEYGDVTEQNYLGGEILFNSGSKSLAVSTLLGNPWKEQDMFGFTPAGKYTLPKWANETGSLQATLWDNGTKSYIAFYDSYRKEYISRAWLNINPSVTKYIPCTGSAPDISDCTIDNAGTTILMKGFDGNTVTGTNEGLSLFSTNNTPLLRIDPNGKMEKYPGIELELDETASHNLLGLRIVSNGVQVGYVGIKFFSNSIEVVPTETIQSTLSTRTNRIVFEKLSNRYVSHKTRIGMSSAGAEGVLFAFRDIGGGEIGTLDTSYTAKAGPVGLEHYPKKAGIGWEDANRMLLEVAAGTMIGSATKFSQTFLTITLGDAVSHLPRVSTTSNFDRTIGTQISTGNGEQIESYEKIDANGDGIGDMVIFYESGKIQLLINYSGSFKDMGYLAYVSDGGKWRKWVGDFSGDGFDDIFLTDAKGKLLVLDNILGKFTRTSPLVVNATPWNTEGYIRQIESFDMDADGKTDLVTLDDNGDLSILYGTSGKEPVFTKKRIESGLGLRLSGEVRNDGGAFSFTGLSFPIQNTDPTGVSFDPDNITGAVNQAMIDNIIYYRFGYGTGDGEWFSMEQADRAIGSSVGANMLRNPDGTYAKDAEGNYIDDAGSVSYDAMSGSSLTGAIDYGQALQNSALAGDIAWMIADVQNLAGPGNTDFSALGTSTSNRGGERVFIRSPFAEGKGLKVEKTYRLLSDAGRDTIHTGDKIRVEIILTNNSPKAFQDAVYLDFNDRAIFQEEQEGIYTIIRKDGEEEQKPLRYLTQGDFDYGFDLATIAPMEVVQIRYIVTATPAAFGKMGVGLLEKGEAGDDIYGDISLAPNNMCGGELMMWRSLESAVRTYEKGTKKFVDNSVLPEELAKNAIDEDKNGIPDYIDELIKSGNGGDIDILKQYSDNELAKYNIDKNGNKIPDRGESKGSKILSYNPADGSIEIGGLSSGNIEAINSGIDEIVQWLGCGFGGGSCLSMPMNWAPLAPGSAPSIMGFPLGPLTPSTGLPVFSALNWQKIGKACVPMPWPPAKSVFCTPLDGAGWWLGAYGPTNFFRLYITPTITGAVGVAACFNTVPAVSGRIPPPGVSPLVPWGNCIVAAKPLFGCKDDGSDGDAGSLGLGSTDYINANSCVPKKGNTALLPEDRKNLLSYVAGDTAHLPEIHASMAAGNLSSLSSGPLIGIGLGSGEDPNFEVSIDATALANFDLGNIIKIKNSRVSAFPDFLMDWATRQLEEIINKLTSLPTLYIILPDFTGFDLSGYKNFPEVFSRWKVADTTDHSASMLSNSQLNNSALIDAQSQYNSLVSDNAGNINSLGKNISGVRAAYEFMSHLPLLKLENEMVDISLPWLSFEEMDKWLIDAKLTEKQWRAEIEDKTEKWSRLGTSDGVDEKVIVETEWLLSSLQENIRIIEEYKRFPEKLQKYLTWKEKYASQILCNIEAIEEMMGGWLSDNGKRFRTWVELYILIKAILKSWQLIVDLFYGYEAECGVCRNERYDLKHFVMKIISAVIPQIPIIQFPKWPDIWLDLHHIRGWLRILMPEFHFNFVPMILPQLPELRLPDVPTLTILLPSLPLLPRLPELPQLPDLPSLPFITLPDLPPPPTIPKIFGGISAVLDIFKIVAKILCIMRTNPFVPEWRAGDQIAQITERQWTLPIDFLNVEFPNFSLSFIDAIKVTTYVNLEFEIDFIVAMAKATLDPLNQFTNDLSNIGSITIPDVDLRDTIPSNIDIPVGPQGYVPSDTPTKNEIMAILLQKFSFDILRSFVALNRYMEEHANEEVAVGELKELLTENIRTIRSLNDPKTMAIADTLQRAVSYEGIAEKKFIQDLSNQNTEKFRLLKDYIKSEQMETIRMKTAIDTMLRTGTATSETTPSFLSVWGENIKAQSLSTDSGFGEDLKKKILATNDRIFPSLSRIQNGGRDAEVSDIQEMGNALVSEVTSNIASFARDTKKNESLHTLAYAESGKKLLGLASSDSSLDTFNNTSGVDLSISNSLWSQDSPTASNYQYEGIYILDKNNQQTRLFNYIDLLDGKEELVYTDVDGDGDDDIIYRMDNSLYLKENFSSDPETSHSSDSPKPISWKNFLNISTDTPRILSAPNHFEETMVSSEEINFSFRPANFTKDSLFRLEYFDYIDRFDKGDSWQDILSIDPKTPFHRIDLIPDLSTQTVSDTSQTGFVGRNNMLSFDRWSGEATVTSYEYQKITKETNGANPLIITEGRTAYTDMGWAVISYLREGETEVQSLVFGASTNYEFLTTAKVWVKSGNLYLFKNSQEQKTLSVSELYGMPILPETRVELTDSNSFVYLSYYDGTSLRLDGSTDYRYYPLGKRMEEYSVSLPASNGWYYAKLFSIEKDTNGTAVSLRLLAPQQESDTDWPLITYDETIRVPVYQKKTLSLSAYLSDISVVNKVWIDADLATDTDGDGNVANDADSLDSSSPYGIRKGNSIYHLEIGPFDTLFTKKVRLFAQDGNGNTSSKDLTLTVYSPVPEIQSFSGSRISGMLDETLGGEPIDVFRLRNGTLSRIDSVGSTSSDGTFSLATNSREGIVLTQSGNTIATINERTGKIALENSSFRIAVREATNVSPFQIQILSPSDTVVFSENIDLSTVSNLQQVSDLDTVTETGIFILPTTGFSFAKNSVASPNLPEGGYITDANHQPIAGISKWGDVYILDDGYELSYATKDSYILLKVQEKNKNTIASILYKIDAEYSMK